MWELEAKQDTKRESPREIVKHKGWWKGASDHRTYQESNPVMQEENYGLHLLELLSHIFRKIIELCVPGE